MLNSNFFRINVDGVHLYRYDLSITPKPRSSSDCRKFLCIALSNAKVEHKRFLYDVPVDEKEPIRIFYSNSKLEGIENAFTVVETNRKAAKSTEYTIRVRQTGELEGKDCGPQIVSIMLNDSIQMLNYVSLKSGFFNMEDIKAVKDTQVRLAKGFSFSVNKSDRDATYTLCIKPEFLTLQSVTVADKIKILRNKGLSNEAINQELKNKNIFVPHSNRFYKIVKLDFGIKPSDPFPAGTEFKSTIDYFQKKYDRLEKIFKGFKPGNIFNEMKNDECMVVSMIPLKQRNTRQVRHNVTNLPPSLCIMGGQPEVSSRDQATITQTRQLTPSEVNSEVKSLINKITGNVGPNSSDYESKRAKTIKDILNNWGISISTELLSVDEKHIEMPVIETGDFGGSLKTELPDPSNGSFRRGLKGPPVRKPNTIASPFENWVFISSERDRKNFWNPQSQDILRKMELKYNEPYFYPARYVNATEVRNVITDLRRNSSKPSIIIIGLANNDARTYKEVKRVCAENDVVSQCINMNNLFKCIGNRSRADSYLWGLFQQIVSKVGGVVWKSAIRLDSVTKVPTMLCGIHYVPPSSVSSSSDGANQFSSTRSSNEGGGYLSMCCSYDQTFVRHFNQCKHLQYSGNGRIGRGTNVEADISEMICNAFDFFGLMCKYRTSPVRLIIFRSGLPEGEVGTVVESEIEAIKNGVRKFLVEKMKCDDSTSEQKMPKITFILVRRRSNARFMGSRGNPIPGTYIEDDRLCVHGSEFYMISGFTPSRYGNEAPCTKPVLYSVKLNESRDQLSLRDIETLVFHTSFNYVNYAGPQSLPITLRYAVSIAQHVSEKTTVAPATRINMTSMNAYPFFI